MPLLEDFGAFSILDILKILREIYLNTKSNISTFEKQLLEKLQGKI